MANEVDLFEGIEFGVSPEPQASTGAPDIGEDIFGGIEFGASAPSAPEAPSAGEDIFGGIDFGATPEPPAPKPSPYSQALQNKFAPPASPAASFPAQATEDRTQSLPPAGGEEPSPELPTGAGFIAKEGMKNIGQDIAGAPAAVKRGLTRGVRGIAGSAAEIASRRLETDGIAAAASPLSVVPDTIQRALPALAPLMALGDVEKAVSALPMVKKAKTKLVKDLREWKAQWDKGSPQEQAEWAEAPLSKALEVAGEGAPLFGAAVAAAIATKSPVIPSLLFGEVGGAETFEEARKAGKSIGVSEILGKLNQAWNVASEGLPFEKMIGNAGKKAAEKIVKGAAIEGVQELVQTMGTNLIAKVGYEPARDIMEGWLEALVGGGVLAGPAAMGFRGSKTAAPDAAAPDTVVEPPPVPKASAPESKGDVVGEVAVDKTVPDAKTRYREAGSVVDGRTVREGVDNQDSIAASLGSDFETVRGIREVPMSDFSLTGKHYSVQGTRRIEALADEISESGEISPLIVVLDNEGAYVLEGATRVEALFRLGAKSFPAQVVIDTSESSGVGAPDTAAPPPVPTKADLKAEAAAVGVSQAGTIKGLKDRIAESKAAKSDRDTKMEEAGIEAPQDVREGVEKEFDPDTRKFAQQVAQSRPETAEGISGLDMEIQHLSDEEAVAEARGRIDKDENAVRAALSDPKQAKDPIVFTAAQLMIDDAIKDGDIEKAVKLVDEFAAQTTTAAQALQKLSLFSKLSPQGMLRFAQTQVNKLTDQGAKGVELTEAEAQQIIDWQQAAEQARRDGDGRAHDMNVARSLALIADKTPKSFWKQVSAVQTMAQLLNLKTIGRNIVGNSMFAGLDNVSKSFATVIDTMASAVTGERTTGLPSIKKQLKGMKQGWQQAVEEISEGIDTHPQQGTKFDLPSARTFSGPIMGALEKGLSYALRAPDRAAFQAEFNDSLSRQVKVSGSDVVTPPMIENAMYDGLYVTFQDDSVAAKAFSGLKKLMNSLTGSKDFGLGDFILKYPKTPANLLQRGIDYSPAGAIRGIMQFAAPMFGKPMNQYRASLNTSRGIVGTGLMTGAIMLAKLGLLTGAGERDRDVEALARGEGRGRYRANVTGIKRFIMSGFDPTAAKAQRGDLYATYDWAQPLALSVGAGATLGETSVRSKLGAKDAVGMVITALDEGSRTLAEQPLLTGIRRVSEKDSPVDVLVDVAQNAPSSFIPTLLGQMAMYADPVIKDTRDRSAVKAMVKRMAKKMPVLNASVPDRVMSTGEKMKIQNPTFFNLFVNPAIASRYEPTAGSQLVVDIFERGLGENKNQFPRRASDRMTINGKSFLLTPEERNKIQETMGKRVMGKLDTLAQKDWAWNSTPEKVARYIDGKILTKEAARARVLMAKELGREEIDRRAAELKSRRR